MQNLINASRTSVTVAVPHVARAAVNTAAAVGAAFGFRRHLLVSARYGTSEGLAASVTVDASSRDAVVRAYSVTSETGASIPGRLHDEVSRLARQMPCLFVALVN